MQTINFTKLKKLPIPKSLDEKLLVSIAQDHLQTIIVNVNPSGELFFDTAINPDWTYAHVKVTAAETPKFKVGDKVKWGHRKARIIRILHDTKEALIEYSVEVSVMGFPEYNDHETRVPLTDLTLITNE